MAIRRVREGEKPAAVIAAYGFCRTTIYKWMKTAAGRGRGLRALSSTRGTGRPRSLTPAQKRPVFRWINGHDPRQYGLDFGLWSRAIVALLIKRKFGIRLGVTAVGMLLAKLELTPQQPLQRAYQRDPEALGYEQVDVLGYSFGGGVALRLAIQHPDQVRRLALVSAGFAQDGFFPELLPMQAAVGAAMFEQMRAP